MSDQNKDNLENFFRERAQHHNLEFNESDWQKLEVKLDEQMPIGSPFWTFLKKYWFIPILFILIPASWFSYIQLSKKDIKSQDQQTRIENNVKDSKTEKDNATIFSKDDQEVYNNKSIEKNIVTENNIKTNAQQSFDKNAIVNTQNGLAYEKNPDKTIFNNIGYAVAENGAESLRHKKNSKLHFLSAITPKLLIEDQGSIDYLEYESVHKTQPTLSKKTSFNIGFGYSPDFSTVGIGNFVSPGTRWTIIVDYAFSKRFQLNTGIVWVNNKYEAYGEDYHAPTRYWKNGIVAEEAYGECKMIDIPLNIRYNALVNSKSQAFLSAGVSTYFLLKEDYYFHYNQDDPELPVHWGTDKMTVYPFGIINFSLGYQFQLTRKSSFQLEPYIKIPTTGIGWGKVDLHTMGVYFMYKYQISK